MISAADHNRKIQRLIDSHPWFAALCDEIEETGGIGAGVAMITDSENKSIPGPRLQRQYLSPSAPNAERMVCESCFHVAQVGGEVIHAADCPYAIEHKAKRVGDAQTK